MLGEFCKRANEADRKPCDAGARLRPCYTVTGAPNK